MYLFFLRTAQYFRPIGLDNSYVLSYFMDSMVSRVFYGEDDILVML